MLIRQYKKLLYDQSGISLVEILVGMAIMLIIIVPISSSLNSGIKAYQYNMSQARNTSSTRELLNAISDELRYAKDVSIVTNTIPVNITYTVAELPRTIYTDRKSVV